MLFVLIASRLPLPPPPSQSKRSSHASCSWPKPLSSTPACATNEHALSWRSCGSPDQTPTHQAQRQQAPQQLEADQVLTTPPVQQALATTRRRRLPLKASKQTQHHQGLRCGSCDHPIDTRRTLTPTSSQRPFHWPSPLATVSNQVNCARAHICAQEDRRHGQKESASKRGFAICYCKAVTCWRTRSSSAWL